MLHRVASLTGFVLAGGASRRMGRNKATLLLDGQTMLERHLSLLRTVCRTTAVAGLAGSYQGLGVPIYPDAIPGCGPLGGIYTALLRTRTEYNLFVSCDLPYLEARFLGWLVDRALEHQADATVPRTPDFHYQPLCAVYRRRTRAAIGAVLEDGQNKVQGFFTRVTTFVVPWTEIARAGFSQRIFGNMNTPEDFEAARAVLGGGILSR